MAANIKTENLITWGFLAFIAYELWSANQPSPGTLSRTTIDTETPVWVQQLSNVERADFNMAVKTNPELADEVIDNLLSIPQGPGGSFQPGGNIQDYFVPTSGIFSMCR
jgi:hypothetical protein